MTSTEFIEEYNKRIVWNLELLKEMGGEIQEDNKYKLFFEECLSTEKIDQNYIEPHSVEIFEENDIIEMQAYCIYKECGLKHYYVNKGETEEVYKKKKIKYLLNLIEEVLKRNAEKIKEVKKNSKDIQVLIDKVEKTTIFKNNTGTGRINTCGDMTGDTL